MSKRVTETARVRKGAVKSKVSSFDWESAAVMASFKAFREKRSEKLLTAECYTTDYKPELSTLELIAPTLPEQKVNVGEFSLIRWCGLNADAAGQLYELGYPEVAGDGGDYARRPCSDDAARAFLLMRSPLLDRLFGHAVILTPENAATLKEVADFFGDGETPDNLINEFHVGGYASALDIVEMVIDGNNRPDDENKALLARARIHFGERKEGGRDEAGL